MSKRIHVKSSQIAFVTIQNTLHASIVSIASGYSILRNAVWNSIPPPRQLIIITIVIVGRSTEERLDACLFSTVQIHKHLLLSERGQLEWKRMYFKLCCCFPHEEQYSDTPQFCTHCYVLFWKVRSICSRKVQSAGFVHCKKRLKCFIFLE